MIPALRLLPPLLLLAVLLPSSAAAGELHEDYDQLLDRYVIRDLYVDYPAWHSNAEDLARLDSYLHRLQEVDPRSLGRDEELAFWINLYNATTLDLILDHWPVASIKELGGMITSPWEKELVEVRGRGLTLDEIENEIIRERFEEPRIHFALNCAALGCPPLASSAYTGDRLEEQLESATRRTVRDRRWVDLSRCRTYGKGSIQLTKIFDWYSEDFGGEAGIRGFLARYHPESRLPLENEGCSLEYLDYDWSLNRPPGPPSPE